MQSVTIGVNQAGQRLDKFLRKYLPNAGAGFLYKMLRKKNITLNGKKAEGSELLALNDRVCFFFSEETFAKFSGLSQEQTDNPILTPDVPEGEKLSEASEEKSVFDGTVSTSAVSALVQEGKRAYEHLRKISVLYEDENILIVNKPPEILTQKAVPGDSSLNEWLIGYLLAQDPLFRKELRTFRPSVCNRLDRNTSGVVLCGKSLAGSQYLSRCIRRREIRKYYRTICAGRLDRPGTMEGRLVKDTRKNRVTVNGRDRDAALIQTAYVPLAWTEEYSLLEVELITGKPHQIRAHMAAVGHPLIGDFKYGSPGLNKALKERYGLSYQLLHACRVEFPKSEDGVGRLLSERKIWAPCPEAFTRLQDALQLEILY